MKLLRTNVNTVIYFFPDADSCNKFADTHAEDDPNLLFVGRPRHVTSKHLGKILAGDLWDYPNGKRCDLYDGHDTFRRAMSGCVSIFKFVPEYIVVMRVEKNENTGYEPLPDKKRLIIADWDNAFTAVVNPYEIVIGENGRSIIRRRT